MKWTLAKVLGLLGTVVCVLLLVLVGIQAITWRLFWVVLILIGGFAYFVLPRMREE